MNRAQRVVLAVWSIEGGGYGYAPNTSVVLGRGAGPAARAVHRAQRARQALLRAAVLTA